MSQIDVYTEPAPKPDGVPLRIYSNPICPFAQVRMITMGLIWRSRLSVGLISMGKRDVQHFVPPPFLNIKMHAVRGLEF